MQDPPQNAIQGSFSPESCMKHITNIGCSGHHESVQPVPLDEQPVPTIFSTSQYQISLPRRPVNITQIYEGGYAIELLHERFVGLKVA